MISTPLAAIILVGVALSGATLLVCWLATWIADCGGVRPARQALTSLLRSGALWREPRQLLRQLNAPH